MDLEPCVEVSTSQLETVEERVTALGSSSESFQPKSSSLARGEQCQAGQSSRKSRYEQE